MRAAFATVLSFTLLGSCLPALAQTAASSTATCTAEAATLTREMEDARARGQMLRRQQLAQELRTVQARCAAGTAGHSRAAQIQALEQRIAQLRQELEQAQSQLRQLQTASP